MRFSKARNSLPIANPFKSKEFHRGACADEELAVVADLHKWNTSDVTIILLDTREEMWLRLGKVRDEPIEARFEMRAGLDRLKEFDFFCGGRELPSRKGTFFNAINYASW